MQQHIELQRKHFASTKRILLFYDLQTGPLPDLALESCSLLSVLRPVLSATRSDTECSFFNSFLCFNLFYQFRSGVLAQRIPCYQFYLINLKHGNTEFFHLASTFPMSSVTSNKRQTHKNPARYRSCFPYHFEKEDNWLIALDHAIRYTAWRKIASGMVM